MQAQPRQTELAGPFDSSVDAADAGESWRQSFTRDGFLVLRDFFPGAGDLTPVVDEITRLGQRIRGPEFDFLDAAAIEQLDAGRRGALYRALRYLPALARLAVNNSILDLSRDLGIAFPLIMRSFNIRMDTPERDEYLFHWHQDTTYLLGSRNALTFWIPLVQVDRKHGSMEVIPGSHLQGLRPVNYTGTRTVGRSTALSPAELHLKSEPEEGAVLVEAAPGDLVVFSQYLLHRSTPNRSRRTRWSVQVRIADAGEQGFIDAGLPMGDASNIFFNDYLGNTADSQDREPK